MKHIIIADNQEITKAGILYLLNGISGSITITEAENKKELITLLLSEPESVVVLDYVLFDIAGVEELQIMRQRFRNVQWILFSDELSNDFIHRVVAFSESFSIVMKDCAVSEITEALRKGLDTCCYICTRIHHLLTTKVYEPPRELQLLTSTEKEILKLIALGKTTKEIASERFSSIHTIMTHRKNIFRKLEVNNIHEATKYALRAGMVDMAEYYI